MVQLSSGNCKRKIEIRKQQENIQLMLEQSERWLTLGKTLYFVAHSIRGFSGIGGSFCCCICAWPEWNAEVGREFITESWGDGNYRRKRNSLMSFSPFPWHSEHEFSLTVRAVSNIQDKLPSSLLHTFPHIYNHCTALNRAFFYLCWLPSMTATLCHPLVCHTQAGHTELFQPPVRNPLCLIKENNHSSEIQIFKRKNLLAEDC